MANVTKYGFITPEYNDLASVPAAIEANNETAERVFDEIEKEIKKGSSAITIDTELSKDSTNPVQNKVITAAIEDIKTTLGAMSDLLDNVNGA